MLGARPLAASRPTAGGAGAHRGEIEAVEGIGLVPSTHLRPRSRRQVALSLIRCAM